MDFIIEPNFITVRYIILLIVGLLIAASVKYGIDLYQDNHTKNVYQYDYAEINKVNYGLFNIQLWKEKALDIVEKRINNFKLSDSAYEQLGGQIELYLYKMYDDYFTSGKLIDEIYASLEDSGTMNKMFMTMMRGTVEKQLKNLDLKSKIPGLASSLNKEIKKNEPEIRQVLQKELLNMVMSDEQSKYIDRRERIYQQYGFDAVGPTGDHLKSEIASIDERLADYLKYIVGLLAAALLLLILTMKLLSFKDLMLGFTIISIVLLVLGITLPMIDIDARLNSFGIEIMGSEISFDEQVLYFQSKSIVEVTKTLWTGGSWDLKLVGALILLFSIVFPFFKLILSILYLYYEKAKSSKAVKTVIFYLGKWSMADVFTVALFMAYIGFYGLVTSQLADISRNDTGFAVETLNYSKLSPGAFFFTAYCLLSITTSLLINRNELKAANEL